MASIWKRPEGAQKGAMVATPPPTSAPVTPEIGTHSLVGGNGQHLVLPARTGGQPWIGYKGSSPQAHPFAPAETFHRRAGGMAQPAPTRLRNTVAAVVNSLTGQAAGTHQLAPGGGVSSMGIQKAPGTVGQ